jgi:hypothetical protein
MTITRLILAVMLIAIAVIVVRSLLTLRRAERLRRGRPTGRSASRRPPP